MIDGFEQRKTFSKLCTARCHRALNSAVWLSLEASHLLLRLLISTFANSGELGDTIEHCRGAKIKAKETYRDSTPWGKRVWALLFLTLPASSERYYTGKARKNKKPTEWSRQMILQVRRWLFKRLFVVSVLR